MNQYIMPSTDTPNISDRLKASSNGLLPAIFIAATVITVSTYSPSAAHSKEETGTTDNTSASIEYTSIIKPLLAKKCVSCHGPIKQEAGLRLDAVRLIKAGSDEGDVVDSENPSQSKLLDRVQHADPELRMPPSGEGEPLSSQQVTQLRKWLDGGMVAPEFEEVLESPENHWAFVLPQRIATPTVQSQKTTLSHTNPIDAFITKKQLDHLLRPLPAADPATLLRRLYLDLIGLPPGSEEVSNFLADPSDEAYFVIVENLLGRPEHGQRWARHWMDVWRYSDWDGYKEELRNSQRHIWRWREWIVDSLNSDKSYATMVQHMLAGDEIAPESEEALAATGFLARNYNKFNRDYWMDNTVEHTAKAFLGLTLNCAKCHDHKYDPLAQSEYYQFRAFFEPYQVRTDLLPNANDVNQDGLPRAFDADLNTPTFLFVRGNEKTPAKDNPLTAAIPSLFGKLPDIQSVPLPVDAYYPSLKPFHLNDLRRTANDKLSKAQQELSSADANLSEFDRDLLSSALTAATLGVQSLESRIAADKYKYLTGIPDAEKIKTLSAAAAKLELDFLVAEAKVKLKKAAAAKQKAEASFTAASPGIPDIDKNKLKASLEKALQDFAAAEQELSAAAKRAENYSEQYTPLGTEYPKISSGRRTALANWIASQENPLTARVAVNHIWSRHFGSGFVSSAADFGLQSEKPPHAELLDYLANYLMDHDWQMKSLHRLIVTSEAYRRASSPAAMENSTELLSGENNITADFQANLAADPNNKWLTRFNARRLEAEVIRDSILAVTSTLDHRFGGPDLAHLQGEKSTRRSLYFQHAYEKQMGFLLTFDAASPYECYQRSSSIVPQQALAMANSAMTRQQSNIMAKQLWSEISEASTAQLSNGVSDKPLAHNSIHSAQRKFISNAFLKVLCRYPSDSEILACEKFLTEAYSTGESTESTPILPGGEDLIHALLNHNDFVMVR